MLFSLDDIARVCHEVNRGVQIATGDPAVSPRWDAAPGWQRQAALAGVAQALAGDSPEQLHESWCKVKRAEGWAYGEVKDAEVKTHPCLVPYAELPTEQRLKDRLFLAVVHTLRSDA